MRYELGLEFCLQLHHSIDKVIDRGTVPLLDFFVCLSCVSCWFIFLRESLCSLWLVAVINDVLYERTLLSFVVQWDGAILHYSRAIDLCPVDATLLSNRAAAYLQKRWYSQALSDADRAISLRPDWHRAWSRKGAALMGLKQFEDATKAYERAVAYASTDDEKVLLRKNWMDAQRSVKSQNRRVGPIGSKSNYNDNGSSSIRRTTAPQADTIDLNHHPNRQSAASSNDREAHNSTDVLEVREAVPRTSDNFYIDGKLKRQNDRGKTSEKGDVKGSWTDLDGASGTQSDALTSFQMQHSTPSNRVTPNEARDVLEAWKSLQLQFQRVEDEVGMLREMMNRFSVIISQSSGPRQFHTYFHVKEKPEKFDMHPNVDSIQHTQSDDTTVRGFESEAPAGEDIDQEISDQALDDRRHGINASVMCAHDTAGRDESHSYPFDTMSEQHAKLRKPMNASGNGDSGEDKVTAESHHFVANGTIEASSQEDEEDTMHDYDDETDDCGVVSMQMPEEIAKATIVERQTLSPPDEIIKDCESPIKTSQSSAGAVLGDEFRSEVRVNARDEENPSNPESSMHGTLSQASDSDHGQKAGSTDSDTSLSSLYDTTSEDEEEDGMWIAAVEEARRKLGFDKTTGFVPPPLATTRKPNRTNAFLGQRERKFSTEEINDVTESEQGVVHSSSKRLDFDSLQSMLVRAAMTKYQMDPYGVRRFACRKCGFRACSGYHTRDMKRETPEESESPDTIRWKYDFTIDVEGRRLSSREHCTGCGCHFAEHETREEAIERKRKEKQRFDRAQRKKKELETKVSDRERRLQATAARKRAADENGEPLHNTNCDMLSQAQRGKCHACNDCSGFCVLYRVTDALDPEVMLNCSLCGCSADSHPIDAAWAEQEEKRRAQETAASARFAAARAASAAAAVVARKEQADAYAVMGIPFGANERTITKAWRRLCRELHPDKQHGKSIADQELARRRFLKIQQSYALLTGKS